MYFYIRFSCNVFEEDVSSEVLIEVKKSILRSLCDERVTSPCCWKISRWSFISKMVNHLAIGAIILPKRECFLKL